MSKRITVHREEMPIYDIVIEKNFDNLIKELVKLEIKEKKICIVTETNVGPYYEKECSALLQPYCKEVHSFYFDAGEKQKNLNTVQNAYRFLIEHKFDRKDLLIALGGGVSGDLTGYIAATYLRGIDFIQVPTSLLSQVDSSIGGKTGVDFEGYKNMIGAFYQPKLVYMNLEALKTLPKREYLSGMGEIVKHGLIRNHLYYEWIQTHRQEILSRNLEALEYMIYESCLVKRAVVERDPEEKGERALLNFGHTLGHAIEKQMDFSLLHGECVGLGMLAAAYLSNKRGMITEKELNGIKELIEDFQLPIQVQGASADEIIKASKSDKKMEHGIIKFVLLKKLGSAYIDRTVTDDELRSACEYCLREK